MNSEPSYLDRVSLVPKVAAAISLLVGAVVLLGWLFDIPTLKSIAPGLASMKPNTAMGFILSGLALWLLRVDAQTTVRPGTPRRIGLVCAALVSLLGLLTLLQYFFGWDLAVDHIVSNTTGIQETTRWPSRMAPATATIFFLIGGSLLIDIETRRSFHPGEWLAVLAAIISLTALLGYAYGIEALYTIPSYSSVALHTALTAFVLSLGALTARTKHGLARVVFAKSVGGHLARRLLPASVVIPFVVGWLLTNAQKAGDLATEFSLALFASTNIALFAWLIWWIVESINRADLKRLAAEREVRRLNNELEERVKERTAQLQAVNRELEAFSYSVSHDLRAPLRHISGFSQALLEDYYDTLDETGKGFLRKVRAASHEMGQLIDDVLQLARVTRSEMDWEPVDLSALARDICAELRAQSGERRVTISIRNDLKTLGDKRLLKIVLSNLLANAWKFTSGKESASISLGNLKQQGQNVYFVEDNGAGFDMAHSSKLFGAFQRLHRNEEFEGTGIGLATVQRIINRHGGSVWATAEVNKGATFYFTLPEAKEKRNERKAHSAG